MLRYLRTLRTPVRDEAAIDILVLCALAYVASFLHAGQFGLYEDDWWRIPSVSQTSLRALLQGKAYLAPLWIQGRPLHDGLIYFLSLVGWKLGGLHALYLCGFLILAVNTAALYLLLRRIVPWRLFALSGAVTFCLFPADTTRPFLTHAFGVQPSLTFLLAACHCYLSGRRLWSYLLVIGCLLSYETFFLVFLAIPLVEAVWDRRLVRSLLVHAAILGSILLLALAIRKAIGDDRASSLGPDVLATALRAMFVGPIASITSFLRVPPLALWQVDRSLLPELGLALGGSWACFSWGLSQFASTPRTFAVRKTAILGAAMLVFSYTLAFTTDPTVVAGRESRVHGPGAVGISILGACLVCAVMQWASVRKWRRLAAVGMGGIFSLLLCVALTVQHDYVRSWSLQRSFWNELVNLSPGLQENTVYLVEPMENPPSIKAFGWSLPLVLIQTYRFPASWRNPPRAFLFPPEWREKYCAGMDLFQASGWVEGTFPDTAESYREAPAKVRLVGMEGGRLVMKPVVCSGGKAEASAAPGTVEIPVLRPKPMYRYLIQ